jgi:hypothetical protein
VLPGLWWGNHFELFCCPDRSDLQQLLTALQRKAATEAKSQKRPAAGDMQMRAEPYMAEANGFYYLYSLPSGDK